MVDILNAGALFLVAGLCVVAVVGGADQLRQDGGPGSGAVGPDAGTSEAEPLDVPDLQPPSPGKDAGRDRGDKDDDRKRDHDGDRHGDDGDDGPDGEDDEEEGD